MADYLQVICLLTDCHISPARNELRRMARLVLHSVRSNGATNRELLQRLSAYLAGPLHRAASEWRNEQGP